MAQKKVEEVRKPGSPPEPGQAQHFDFRLFILTTTKEYISVGLSHQVCGNLLWKPYESNTDGEENDAQAPYKVRGKELQAGRQGVETMQGKSQAEMNNEEMHAATLEMRWREGGKGGRGEVGERGREREGGRGRERSLKCIWVNKPLECLSRSY